MDNKKNVNAKIDELVDEFKKVENWNEIIPDFDDEALMVHWTNISVVPWE